MRCITCQKLSLQIICKRCQGLFLKPSLRKRDIDGFAVYSFYMLSEIEDFIRSKYYFAGSSILKIVAQNSFREFAHEFQFSERVDVVPIDDRVKNGYSHTAILAKQLQNRVLSVKYATLHATNDIKYAGKDLHFRERNSKAFQCKRALQNSAILVDDVVTTGSTMKQAKEELEKNGVQVLFGLVLADAKEGFDDHI